MEVNCKNVEIRFKTSKKFSLGVVELQTETEKGVLLKQKKNKKEIYVHFFFIRT